MDSDRDPSAQRMPPEGQQQEGSEDEHVEVVDQTTQRSSSKGGRKPDPVRAHFTATGARNSSCKRAPVKCNYCDRAFTASQAGSAAAVLPHVIRGLNWPLAVCAHVTCCQQKADD